MLEESISCSPGNDKSRSRSKRLHDRARRRNQKKNVSFTNDSCAGTSFIDAMYEETDPESLSRNLQYDRFNPFESGIILAAADTTVTIVPNPTPKELVFHDFVRADALPTLNSPEILPATDERNATNTSVIGLETQFGITESEFVRVCDDAIFEDKSSPHTTTKSVVDEILEDFCGSPCSESPPKEINIDASPVFLSKYKPMRTYSRIRPKKSCRRLSGILLNDGEDGNVSDSSSLSIQECSGQTSVPQAETVDLNKSIPICKNLLMLSSYFSQLPPQSNFSQLTPHSSSELNNSDVRTSSVSNVLEDILRMKRRQTELKRYLSEEEFHGFSDYECDILESPLIECFNEDIDALQEGGSDAFSDEMISSECEDIATVIENAEAAIQRATTLVAYREEISATELFDETQYGCDNYIDFKPSGLTNKEELFEDSVLWADNECLLNYKTQKHVNCIRTSPPKTADQLSLTHKSSPCSEACMNSWSPMGTLQLDALTSCKNGSSGQVMLLKDNRNNATDSEAVFDQRVQRQQEELQDDTNSRHIKGNRAKRHSGLQVNSSEIARSQQEVEHGRIYTEIEENLSHKCMEIDHVAREFKDLPNRQNLTKAGNVSGKLEKEDEMGEECTNVTTQFSKRLSCSTSHNAEVNPDDLMIGIEFFDEDFEEVLETSDVQHRRGLSTVDGALLQQTCSIISIPDPTAGFGIVFSKHGTIGKEIENPTELVGESVGKQESPKLPQYHGKQISNPIFCEGFKTASNKVCKISEKAKELALKLVQEVNNEGMPQNMVECFEKDVEHCSYSTIRTNSDKTCAVSQETKQCAQTLAQENNKRELTQNAMESPEDDQGSKYISPFIGFKTASNKACIVSDEAKRRAQLLVNEVNAEQLNPEMQECFEKDVEHCSYSTIRTNSDKTCAVSQETKQCAQTLAQENNKRELTQNVMESPEDDQGSKYISPFIGFKTASNKACIVSDEAKRRAQLLVNEVNAEQLNPEMQEYFEKDKPTSRAVLSSNSLKKVSNSVGKIFVEERAGIVGKGFSSDDVVRESLEKHGPNARNSDSAIVDLKSTSNRVSKMTTEVKRGDLMLANTVNTVDRPQGLLRYLEKNEQIAFNKNEQDQVATSSYECFNNISTKISNDVKGRGLMVVKEDTNHVQPNGLFSNINPNQDCKTSKIDQLKLRAHPMGNKLQNEKLPEVVIECFEENDQSSKAPFSFIGFKTASNKVCKISEEAKRRAQILVSEVNNEKLPQDVIDCFAQEERPKNEPPFTGFKTASNKECKISEEAKKRAQILVKEVDNEQLPQDVIDCFVKEEHLPFIGFKAASCKDCMISKEAKRRAQTFVNEVNNEKLPQDVIDCFVEEGHPGTESFFIGFKTASNKECKISEEAKKRAQVLVKEVNTEQLPQDVIDYFMEEEHPVNELPSVGFKTTSNKACKISEDSKKRTQAIVKEVNNEQVSQGLLDCFERFEQASNFNSPAIGCKIVPNEDLKILVQQKYRTQSLVNGLNNGKVPQNVIGPFEEDDQSSKSSSPFIGFKTASNKACIVTEEAKNRAQLLIKEVNNEEIHQDLLECFDKIECYSEPSLSSYLKTSSNKVYKLSEETKQRRQSMTDNTRRLPSDMHQYFEKQVLTAASSCADLGTSLNKVRELIEDPKQMTHMSVKEANSEGSRRGLLEILNQGELIPSPVFSSTGFKTASNKQAHQKMRMLVKQINGEKRSQELLECIEKDEQASDIKDEHVSAAASSNKIRQVSKEAKQSPQGPANKVDNTNLHQELVKSFGNNDQASSYNSSTISFKTASNKLIKISDEARRQAQTLVKELNNEKLPQGLIDCFMGEQNFNPDCFSIGFKTASNKDCKISEKARRRAQTLIKEVNNEKLPQDLIDCIIEKGDPKQECPSTDTKTTAEIPCKISETVNKCAQALSKGVSNTELHQTLQDCLNSGKQMLNPSLSFSGFKTASNQICTVSEEAKRQAQMLIKEVNNEELPEDFLVNLEKDEEMSSLTPSGFNSILEKPQTLSTENESTNGLIQCNQKRRKISGPQRSGASTGNCSPVSTTDITDNGFKTASNKTCQISEKAKRQAELMIKKIIDEDLPKDFFHGIETESKFAGEHSSSITKPKQIGGTESNLKVVNAPCQVASIEKGRSTPDYLLSDDNTEDSDYQCDSRVRSFSQPEEDESTLKRKRDSFSSESMSISPNHNSPRRWSLNDRKSLYRSNTSKVIATENTQKSTPVSSSRSRKNILSLSKRRKLSSRSVSIEIPAKINQHLNPQPHPVQSPTYHAIVKSAATSTPRQNSEVRQPFKDFTMDNDFRQIQWEDENKWIKSSSLKEDQTSGLEATPSPSQKRIERLRMYGEPKSPLSPILMDKPCRPSGLRRRRHLVKP